MQFKNIYGQESIKKRLIQSVDAQRISHAQLFLGPEGSLKLPMAIAYAQYISCTNRIKASGDSIGDSCGECPSCIKFNKLIHPDLHFIFPVIRMKGGSEKTVSDDYLDRWRSLLIEKQQIITLNDWNKKIEVQNQQPIINAEDCNQIIRKLSYKSYESEYKFLIIWMAEKLYYAAAPKLLKILEEPPDKTLFILIAEREEQMLNTILSRTQIIKFKRLTTENVSQWLAVNTTVSHEIISRTAHLSNGDLTTAYTLLEESDEAMQDFNLFRQWLRLCFKPVSNMNDLIDLSEKMASMGRENQKNYLNYGLNAIREAFVYNITKRTIPYENEESEFIKKLSPFIHETNIEGLEKAINDAIFHIERNINAKILFLDLSLIIVKLIRQKKLV